MYETEYEVRERWSSSEYGEKLKNRKPVKYAARKPVVGTVPFPSHAAQPAFPETVQSPSHAAQFPWNGGGKRGHSYALIHCHSPTSAGGRGGIGGEYPVGPSAQAPPATTQSIDTKNPHNALAEPTQTERGGQRIQPDSGDPDRYFEECVAKGSNEPQVWHVFFPPRGERARNNKNEETFHDADKLIQALKNPPVSLKTRPPKSNSVEELSMILVLSISPFGGFPPKGERT